MLQILERRDPIRFTFELPMRVADDERHPTPREIRHEIMKYIECQRRFIEDAASATLAATAESGANVIHADCGRPLLGGDGEGGPCRPARGVKRSMGFANLQQLRFDLSVLVEMFTTMPDGTAVWFMSPGQRGVEVYEGLWRNIDRNVVTAILDYWDAYELCPEVRRFFTAERQTPRPDAPQLSESRRSQASVFFLPPKLEWEREVWISSANEPKTSESKSSPPSSSSSSDGMGRWEMRATIDYVQTAAVSDLFAAAVCLFAAGISAAAVPRERAIDPSCPLRTVAAFGGFAFDSRQLPTGAYYIDKDSSTVQLLDFPSVGLWRR